MSFLSRYQVAFWPVKIVIPFMTDFRRAGGLNRECPESSKGGNGRTVSRYTRFVVPTFRENHERYVTERRIQDIQKTAPSCRHVRK